MMINKEFFLKGYKSILKHDSPAIALGCCFIAIGALLKNLGFNKSIKQINLSVTKSKGVIRGLHFQSRPFSETKIVTCIRGEVFDVAVDIRKESPTYLRWFGVVLSPDKNNSFFIPDGFAHGFQSLSDNCELVYMHSELYNQDSEGILNAFDPKIAISWPLSVLEMSDRDRNAPMIFD